MYIYNFPLLISLISSNVKMIERKTTDNDGSNNDNIGINTRNNNNSNNNYYISGNNF